MNEVSFYIEFAPRDFNTDVKHDLPSCAKDSTFGDDASSFAEQKFKDMKPNTHFMMSHSDEASQQGINAPYHNVMMSYLHPNDKSQQDLDAMD